MEGMPPLCSGECPKNTLNTYAYVQTHIHPNKIETCEDLVM